jgi:hypothetical protein
MTSKDTLHALIDTLPETKLDAARLYLEALRAEDDPVLHALLNAPDDDEPETEEERAAVQEAREASARGDVYTLEEVSRELGL